MGSKYTLLREESDAQIFRVDGREVKVIYGFSTGSELGCHNSYGSDSTVEIAGEHMHGFNIAHIYDEDGCFAHADGEQRLIECIDEAIGEAFAIFNSTPRAFLFTQYNQHGYPKSETIMCENWDDAQDCLIGMIKSERSATHSSIRHMRDRKERWTWAVESETYGDQGDSSDEYLELPLFGEEFLD
jgi:hypothetical protein